MVNPDEVAHRPGERRGSGDPKKTSDLIEQVAEIHKHFAAVGVRCAVQLENGAKHMRTSLSKHNLTGAYL